MHRHSAHVLCSPLPPPISPLPKPAGVDTFTSRIAPARAYDQLDPDFNYALFVILLLGGAAGTWWMGRAVTSKDVHDGWK